MNIQKVAIVGSGAVGSYYGARLAASGLDVCFLLRSDYEHVKKHGLQVSSVAGDFELSDVSCAQTTKEIGEVDLVIIAWKTTANSNYEAIVRPLLYEKTLILTLQNGLGNTERLAELFGAERIFGGLCFVCINRISPGKICHTASGLIRIGQFVPADKSDHLELLVDLLSTAKIDCHVVENLKEAQWMKLVWNIPFNGLAISLGGVDTQALLSIVGIEKRIMALMKEIQLIASVLGYNITDQFLERQIAITGPMEKYRPSSMIDFVEGKDVEVNSIWREPLRIANGLGIEAPEITKLLHEIEGQINRRGI